MITDKEELGFDEKRLVNEGKLLSIDYRKRVCGMCVGTKQQKKRDCALFRGYSKPSCSHMSRSVNRKLKDKQEELMQKSITILKNNNNQN